MVATLKQVKETAGQVFGKLGSVITWIKWILVFAFVVAMFILGKNFYPIAKDCWTCKIFESLYDAFSKISTQTISYFQDITLTLISPCFALWVVYETYRALSPSLNMLYPDAPKFDSEYLKKIYKKIFLTSAIIGLFLINSPRNIFANTFEITLDFGSGVGREFLRKKIIDKDKIPPECQHASTELEYMDDMALSETTKQNMVCLLKEVNVLRQDYMDLGLALFEQGKDSIITTVFVNIAIRIGTFITGNILAKFGGKTWLKKIEKKLGKKEGKLKKLGEKLQKYEDAISTSTDKNNTKKLQKKKEKIKKAQAKNTKQQEKIKEKIENVKDDISSGGKNKKRINTTGRILRDNGDKLANASTILAILTNSDVRIGLSGLCLVIGLFIINMFFAFIIIEHMLFLGISIIILPILAGCYIFEQTRSFATVSIRNTFKFAIGLIFMCIAMVMCSEINDWILGGMFSSYDENNITSTQYAINVLKSGNIEQFIELVGNTWYFLYIIFAIGIDAIIIRESTTFASWFGGSISQSKLVEPLWNMGKSSYNVAKSTTREISNYIKTGYTTSKYKSSTLNNFLQHRLSNNNQQSGAENEEV